jgi:esterase/lipase
MVRTRSRLLRRLLAGTLLVLAVVAAAAIATAPTAISHVARAPGVPADLDAWIADRESSVRLEQTIIEGAEKRIRWFNGSRNARTEYALVYLHGFSATRQELAPLGAQIADQLGANLFETRLRGHGLSTAPLAGVRAEEWLDDAAEAITIGAEIGDQVIVMGTSTGATLALAMTDHPTFDAVAGIVLISPNFAPRDSTAEILTWPGGPQLARLMVGETRSWTPANDAQERFWSTTYPMAATVEMMRLVKLARSKLPMTLSQPLLTLYSPNDQVIDTGRIEAALKEIDSPRSEVVRIEQSGDPSNHVLAGDILAPENNRLVAGHIVRFLTAADL